VSRGYDAWLEEPYQREADDEARWDAVQNRIADELGTDCGCCRDEGDNACRDRARQAPGGAGPGGDRRGFPRAGRRLGSGDDPRALMTRWCAERSTHHRATKALGGDRKC